MNLEFPINSVSFGQVSINLLKEFYKKKLEPCVFPVANQIDINAFELDKQFVEWLQNCINKSLLTYSRENPSLRLWHINGSYHSVSKKNGLFTFHETDRLTDIEKNVLSNYNKVFVSSSYTKKVFESFGLTNVVYAPLGFDADSFKKTNKKYLSDKVTVWGLYGKLESRKNTIRIIQNWCKLYGNNNSHVLHVAVFNPFLKPEEQGRLINEARKDVYNVNIIPHTATNRAFNDVLNASNIVISLSGGEGFELPFFQSLCLGKHGVCLKAHAYLDYTNENNVTYIEPSGMKPVYDGVFFQENQPFNQGNIYDWKDEDFAPACEAAYKKYKESPINLNGESLKEKFTWENTVNKIIENVNS